MPPTRPRATRFLRRRSLRRLAGLLLAACCAVGGQAVAAAPYRVGVIVSRAGTARAAGAAQALAAVATAARLRAQGGVFGEPMEITLRDDAGDPARALQEARALAEDVGVDALVCCTVPAASARVAAWAEGAGVLLLSPTVLPAIDQPYWTFSLAPREQDALAAVVAAAQADGARSLALMTLDNAFGDDASSTLQDLVQIAGMGMAGEARYPPGATDLRAEALWAASREAGAVVVWGLRDDLAAAVDGLRRRGWRGPVYARPALLDPATGGLPLAGLDGVRFPVAPVTVADALPDGAACASQARAAAAQLRSVAGGVVNAAAAAPVMDAVMLLQAGFEQRAALRLPDGEPGQRRQALRDSLVGLPAQCGAGGSHDLVEGRRATLDPASLAVAVVTSGRLRAAP